jgi:exopolyphosphatase / guanosine-5'-triphosphate,3'-diphosphate pyrophosphatase
MSNRASRTDSTSKSDHLAAIDMGSNSFRLEIGQLTDGRYRRIDYLKETVRLGAGLDEQGMLTEEATERGLACLARFAQRLKGYAPTQVRAVATQTLREARNRDAFLLRAQASLGYSIEVISGREEARLIYTGVSRLQPSKVSRLVIDIGGRSTEMILGCGTQALRAESFQVGSVSLSLKYFGDGRYTEAAFRQAQIAAGAELEEALEPFAAKHWQEALGSSGTVGAVSQLLLASGVTDGRITPESLRWLIEQCLAAGTVEALSLPGLKEDRRAVIAGGLAILYTLAVHFDIAELQPARGALRQGVIFDLAERQQPAVKQPATPQQVTKPHDVRDTSVRELQQRFMVDVEQADRVTQVAEQLYASTQTHATSKAGISANLELRNELRWACALHETGMMVSHHDHHRHSAYLLAHADAAGFSQNQLRRISDLVLGQRGGLRKLESNLSTENFALQLLCLRLGVIKCHARRLITPHAIRLKRRGLQVELSSVPGWAADNPRTKHLLTEEAVLWERSGPLRLVLKVSS